LRSVILDSIGWRIGKGKAKRFCSIQELGKSLGSNVPKRLEHSEKASFLFTLAPDWSAHFTRTFVESAQLLPTLRGMVSTSVGTLIEIKPSQELLKRLRAAFDEQAAASAG